MMNSDATYELLSKEETAEVAVSATPLVRVVAPATLPAGYTFAAEVAGQIVTVTVPEGGVKEGDTLTVPLSYTSTKPRSNVPVGAWRDGLCNFCAHGCCHPLFCLTFWFHPFALAQVMTRVHLNWMGEYVGPARASATFKIIAVLFVAFYILENAIGSVMGSSPPIVPDVTIGEDGYPVETFSIYFSTTYLVASSMHYVLSLTFGIYLLVLTIRTRAYIRSKYAIPEQSCVGCEDCCCAFWCSPCVTCQMARHTADYQKHPAACCTETGLPPHVPSIVV